LVNDAADWVTAHAALSRLAQERAALDVEEGRWLLFALRSSVHVHLGHGSFLEYIERLSGYKPRTTREKLRVAEALEVLPRVAHALEAGALSWCAARELTRVALPQTEQAGRIDAHSKVFSALRHLGFREGEVNAVLAALRDDAGLRGASVERLLREALCRIRPTAR
jgi:hypothetical protein